MGVAAGFVWELLATPAEWEVRDTGIVMDEAASKGQFSVLVVFVAVGIVASLLLGSVLAWALRDAGWVVTPLVVAATVAASVIAWRLGILLGPPDPSSVKGVSVGDHIPARLAIDGLTPFLVWPIFGLIGLIVTTLIGVAREPLAAPQHPYLGDVPYS
jgi:hypothetical protein